MLQRCKIWGRTISFTLRYIEIRKHFFKYHSPPSYRDIHAYVYHAHIQEFSSGGVQVRLTKKADKVFFSFFFLVLSLLYRSQMVNFKEIYHFSRFQMGSNYFQGGGGVQLGGVGTPCPPPPPSGSALVYHIYSDTLHSTCYAL